MQQGPTCFHIIHNFIMRKGEEAQVRIFYAFVIISVQSIPGLCLLHLILHICDLYYHRPLKVHQITVIIFELVISNSQENLGIVTVKFTMVSPVNLLENYIKFPSSENILFTTVLPAVLSLTTNRTAVIFLALFCVWLFKNNR